MAKKLYTVEEAAAMLGVSVDDLTAMRERGEAYAYKDGGVWKFREDEVQRIKAEHEDGPLDFGLAEGGSSGVLDSKVGSSNQMIAGKTPGPGSELGLADSGLSLSEETPLAASEGSDKLASVFEDLDDLSLQVDEGSIKGVKSGPVAPKPAPKTDEISLSDDDFSLATGGGSAVDLTGEDDDLVLTGTDSDITKRPHDSGINLSPTDSGLSLEEPVPIGGSAVDSFQLGEDSSIRFDEKATGDSPTQKQSGVGIGGLGGDDFDFTATPTADDEDSGSQVIPIDEDEDDLGLAASDAGLEVEETAPSRPTPAMLSPEAAVYAPPEAPYTIWNVLSLVCCTLLLFFGGMIMYDLIRNMWSWDQPYRVSSGIIDSVAAWFNKK